MCKWGTYEEVECIVVASLSHTRQERKKLIKIDKCIAYIVRALSQAGIRMISSCCGHGKKDGWIVLDEGFILNIKEIKKFGAYEFKKSESMSTVSQMVTP